MPKYVVRFNCEHSVLVTARGPKEAIKKVDQIPADDWDQKSTSRYEVERES